MSDGSERPLLRTTNKVVNGGNWVARCRGDLNRCNVQFRAQQFKAGHSATGPIAAIYAFIAILLQTRQRLRGVSEMRFWIIVIALVGCCESGALAKDTLADIFASPNAFEGKIVSVCGRRPIDGPTVMVGNMGRSPTRIWLDRPINAASGCIRARVVRAQTPSPDPRLADGPVDLSGWRLKVLDILPSR